MDKTQRLAKLAELMGLDPVLAVALPATLTAVAAKCKMSEHAALNYMERNPELREYLRTVLLSQRQEIEKAL